MQSRGPVFTAVLLSGLSIAGLARADLSHETYAGAKAAYARMDCPKTLELLSSYKDQDSAFLAQNAEILKRIDDVVARCTAVLKGGGTLTMGGVKVVPPTLP